MGLSVSGLVNGIDVPTIVSQLMQSESIPQQRLQSQLTTVQLQASTYRAVNSKFQALLTAAQALTTSSVWATTTATSSDSSVAVNSTGTAQAGAVAFTVKQLATAESQLSAANPPYTSPTDAYASPTIQFVDSNNKATTITVGGTGTLNDAVTAINAANLGVKASVMQVGTGQYQLLVSATTTGAASHFTLDGGAGWSELTAAQDAQLQIGTTNTSTVQSPTNTITGLLPGVTLTVTQQTASPVTVSVVANPQAIGDKMKALIDAANAVISEVSTDTDTGMGGATSGKAGPLPGDYSVQNLAQQVRRIVSSAVGTLGSPAQIGLELSSGADGTVDGTIAFDENTFVSALKSNPTMVQQMVQNIPATTSGTTTTPSIDGIAKQLATLASQATDSVTGTLVTLANGEDSQAKSLQGQIDDWTTRLTLIQQQLTTTYTNMESMLSTLQSQQSWLTSMVNSLSGSSSSGSSKSSASVS